MATERVVYKIALRRSDQKDARWAFSPGVHWGTKAPAVAALADRRADAAERGLPWEYRLYRETTVVTLEEVT